ncbi:MAG: PAS-domain containing protein [Rhizobiaceae bacterium]|jgi:signal transduction histidine kinase|nr:PAS-domain containing protein [Rhizobiaceae bacterium]
MALTFAHHVQRVARFLVGTSAIALVATAAAAQEAPQASALATHDVIQLAMFVGAMSAALLSAVWMIRLRARTARDNDLLRARVSEQTALLERYETLGELSGQMVLVWTGADEKPDMLGRLPVETGAPDSRAAALGFSRWLPSDAALDLQRAIEAMRAAGTPFSLLADTLTGASLEIIGRTSGNRAVVRFIALSERQAEAAHAHSLHQAALAERDKLRSLLDAVSAPAWLRDARGELQWVNRAYAQAAGQSDAATVVAARTELLGSAARRQIAEAQLMGDRFHDRVTTVVGHDRKRFDVTDIRIAADGSSAGIALDVSEAELLKSEVQRVHKAHADTLDHLATAVAIFDAEARLAFHNAAFQKLWQVDAAFLDKRPTHAILLDRLRADGRLPEGPDWRLFKDRTLAAYRALEAGEEQWHLPDGKILRVLTTPNPGGGLTQVFENLTQQFTLESENKTLLQVRKETLDHLAEAVAVFGTDGSLKLFNPAFRTLWGLEGVALREGMHIRAIAAAAKPVRGVSPWPATIAAITGAPDSRVAANARLEFADDTVLAQTIAHLPNGQTMLTFMDVTDSVSFERVLKSRNAALEDAALVKNRFVHHMSYELRSPLTSIKGFAEVLKLGVNGVLTPKQTDYVDHILRSSQALEMLVNDVLDLATIDADMMQLAYGQVDVRQTIEAAGALLAERLREHGLRLDVHVGAGAETFEADALRVRQVLFNLIDNAANYAPEGSAIRVSAEADQDRIRLTVEDQGPGIPPEELQHLLDRFESRVLAGGRRRGAGIGLSIVSGFVKLHKGAFKLDSAIGQGTRATCLFPKGAAAGEAARSAAE